MQVIKRGGHTETMKFDKVTARVRKASKGLFKGIDPVQVTQKVVEGLFDGVTSQQVDLLVAETCASLIPRHPDYGVLATRVEVSRLHKETPDRFSTAMEALYATTDVQGNPAPQVSDELISIVRKHKDVLDDIVVDERDFDYKYFGFKTLEKKYCRRVNGKVVERPQYLLLRVSIGIHGEDLAAVKDTYEAMSTLRMTHATPTLLNAGTTRPQMSSCFLLTVEDNLDHIYDVVKQAAMISQSGGGIGINYHGLRAKNSYIRSSGGRGNGIVPALKVFNETARYVNQGGARPGAIAAYLEPWHADILDFLDLRKNHGAEQMRARDLFLGMWIPDLFMRRVQDDGQWSLFCPDECPGLPEAFDDHGAPNFTRLYESYEASGKARKVMPARELFAKIVTSQIETGLPYMMYKDAANRHSNQKNLGTIKGSNLCTEILEYTSREEVAVCNLASISLPAFVTGNAYDPTTGSGFDFHALAATVRQATFNLNRVIDRNFYPIPEARYSNFKNRPIGLGVQGLADAFSMLGLSFDGEPARDLNRRVFETLYYAALQESCRIASVEGPYDSYAGSPMSQGILHWDSWAKDHSVTLSGMWNWDTLREEIRAHGIRNSLLVAPMPTASTAQILGNNEAFEAYTDNLYVRRTQSGEFTLVNDHLVKDLQDLGLWDHTMYERLLSAKGSVQNIPGIPDNIRERYRTVWEIPQRSVLEMAADRAPFIDQTQSMNVFMANANVGKISSMHHYGWQKGLKTGMYYLRTPPARDAVAVTAKKFDDAPSNTAVDADAVACSLDNPEACEACSG